MGEGTISLDRTSQGQVDLPKHDKKSKEMKEKRKKKKDKKDKKKKKKKEERVKSEKKRQRHDSDSEEQSHSDSGSSGDDDDESESQPRKKAVTESCTSAAESKVEVDCHRIEVGPNPAALSASKFFAFLKEQELNKPIVGTIHAKGHPKEEAVVAKPATGEWECSRCAKMNEKIADVCVKCRAMKRLNISSRR